MPIISVRRQVMRAFELPPSSLNPFSLSLPAALDAALSAGGFGQIRMDTMRVAYTFGSVDEYVEHQRDLHENRLDGLHEQSRERQAEFWSAVGAAARAYTGPDGLVDMTSEVLLVTAQA